MTTPEPPQVDFVNFVASFAATGVAAFQEIEMAMQEPDDGDEEGPTRDVRISQGLMTIQHLIDTLALLEKKTEGNLTDQEKQVLQTTLTELRFGYVRLRDKRQQRK